LMVWRGCSMIVARSRCDHLRASNSRSRILPGEMDRAGLLETTIMASNRYTGENPKSPSHFYFRRLLLSGSNAIVNTVYRNSSLSCWMIIQGSIKRYALGSAKRFSPR
jgi:hypothetical protein